MDYANCPAGKVPLYPPNGGQEPTYFLERHVSQQLNRGWTLEPRRATRVARAPEPKRSSTTRRAGTSSQSATDKPKQDEQGTEDNS